MNKQELIDKAVRDCNGEWPHDKGVILNVAGPCNVSHTPFLSFDFSATNAEYSQYWSTLCTKEEFEQRAKKLGYGADGDWYDYESQKAIKLPPVGVECEYVDCHKFEKVRNDWFSGQKLKVLSCEPVEGNSVAVVFNVDVESAQCLVQQCMRPLDWDRKAEQERKKVVDAAISAWSEIPDMTDFKECFYKLYDLGHLKLPEQKDE